MERLAAIEELIAPTLEAMGYALVRVRLTGGGRPTLQVMAERQDGGPMGVEDCVEISRTISAVLDVSDPLPGAYLLEVSSPGLDRPLVKAADYERFAGEAATIETAQPIDGRKRFRGRLGGLVEGGVRLMVEDGEVVLPLAAIQRAKLLVTDEMLATAKRRNEKS